jgi:hypothetical protein
MVVKIPHNYKNRFSDFSMVDGQGRKQGMLSEVAR